MLSHPQIWPCGSPGAHFCRAIEFLPACTEALRFAGHDHLAHLSPSAFQQGSLRFSLYHCYCQITWHPEFATVTRDVRIRNGWLWVYAIYYVKARRQMRLQPKARLSFANLSAACFHDRASRRLAGNLYRTYLFQIHSIFNRLEYKSGDLSTSAIDTTPVFFRKLLLL